MNEPSCERYQEELLALHEGWLDAEAAGRLRRHLEACAPCRSEYEWIQGVSADLEHMGDAAVRDLPKISLVDNVMAAVAGAEVSPKAAETSKNISRLQDKREQRLERPGFASGFWAGLAVAAALLLVAGLTWKFALQPTQDDGAPKVATHAPGENGEETVPGEIVGSRGAEAPSPERELFEKAARQLSEQMLATRPPKLEPFREEPVPALASVGVKDVIEARREAMKKEGGWARLIEMASLNPQAAREVVENPDTSPAAVVGATDSLGAEEAAQVLLSVMGHYGDDPAVRLAAAEAYGEQKTPAAEAQQTQQIFAAQQAADHMGAPNALFDYMTALQYLEQGDIARGLELLAAAANSDKIATAYALQNAQYQEQALIAAGMDPEAARLAAAMTVGMDESAYLTEMANSLLAEGRGLLDTGQIQAANDVFNAVQRFGEQVAAGALTSQEQLAGLDIQRLAIETYNENSASLALDAAQLQTLVEGTNALVESFMQLSTVIMAIEELFSNAQVSNAQAAAVMDATMTQGDLAVFLNPEAYSATIASVVETIFGNLSTE